MQRVKSVIMMGIVILMGVCTVGCNKTDEKDIVYQMSKMNQYKVNVPSFLTKEQQQLFVEAYDIQIQFYVSTGYGEYNEKQDTIQWKAPDGTTYSYIKCDENIFPSYKTFEEYLNSVYTKEAVETLLSSSYYIEHEGKLYYMMADRGTNIMYDSHYYQLISRDKKKIRFKACVHYAHPEFKVEEPYGESEFTLICTKEGWRFSQFELWK